MKALVTFALKNDLDKGLGASDVCNRVARGALFSGGLGMVD